MARRVEHPTPSQLHCLFLPGTVILPGLQITLPISNELAPPLIKLLQTLDYPIIGVFPLPIGDRPYSRYGCAARVIRVPRATTPLTGSESAFNLTLQGLTRIYTTEPLPNALPLDPLSIFAVTYPSLDDASEAPSKEIVHTFRTAAFRLLDRLDLETPHQSSSSRIRPDVWRRLRSLVQEVNEDGAVWLADIIMGVVDMEWDDKMAFLAVSVARDRLVKATEIFNKRSDISEVSSKISQEVGESLSKQQKEYFLRQQLQAIQKELQRLTKPTSTNALGEKSTASGTNRGSNQDLDDEQDENEELSELRKKVETMRPGSEERKMAAREWKRLKRIPSGSVENGVIRTYLDWLTSLPWPSISPEPETSTAALMDQAFLSNARAQLNGDHYGLEKIKRRLIEYLAVVKLKTMQAAKETELQSIRDGKVNTLRFIAHKGPILLLVGPPGCGKTSIAQSIAKALHRPFQRIGLGGVRDEAEIRGHRRTYVASSPGAIVQALRRAGRPDMLLLLDEIDKVGHNNIHGDPSAALLEVLDPEQNYAFSDHYINVPIDLSQVIMVATANTLDTISAPLLDRCEVVKLSGVTHLTKSCTSRKIFHKVYYSTLNPLPLSKSFLLPKQIKANGLPPDQLEITDAALHYITARYTREAGVRSLERQIGAVVRFKAVQWADIHDSPGNDDTMDHTGYKKHVDAKDVSEILGVEWWNPEERDSVGKRGVVNGLVVQGEGEGGLLSIETLLVPGTGRLRATGSLGEVIKESGDLALSWVKANAYNLGITSSPSEDPLLVPDGIDIHLHLPSGAQKKDGPSAGLAMICAFVSILIGAIVPATVALTGEVTLRGHVTPIGGVKEKVLGAHRAAIKKVILPARNAKEFQFEFGKHPLRNEMEVVFVSTIREGLEAAFGPGALTWRDDRPFVAESRL